MKLKKKYIVGFIFLATFMFLAFLFVPINQRIYSFSDVNGKPAEFFTEVQLKDLKKNNSVLALSIEGALYIKKENINFHIFSKNDFLCFKPKSFVIMYDGETKEITTNVQYRMNTNNPNFERERKYEFEGNTIQGFEKEIYGGFENFDYCLVDFDKLFYRNHRKEHDKFRVTIIVNYYLDEYEYEQELNYSVECLKIPFNFFTFLLSKIPCI